MATPSCSSSTSRASQPSAESPRADPSGVLEERVADGRRAVARHRHADADLRVVERSDKDPRKSWNTQGTRAGTPVALFPYRLRGCQYPTPPAETTDDETPAVGEHGVLASSNVFVFVR
jgi:hypothetical protein